MNRETMIDNLIKIFGLEDSRVVWFCGLCEEYINSPWNNICLENIYKALIDLQQYESALE